MLMAVCVSFQQLLSLFFFHSLFFPFPRLLLFFSFLNPKLNYFMKKGFCQFFCTFFHFFFFFFCSKRIQKRTTKYYYYQSYYPHHKQKIPHAQTTSPIRQKERFLFAPLQLTRKINLFYIQLSYKINFFHHIFFVPKIVEK